MVSKIADFKSVLINPAADRKEKQEALKYLVHFIEDLHQPMHASDNDGRGGNLTQVRFFNTGSNLHRVWDSQIIEYASENEQNWLRYINTAATARNIADWSKGTPEEWATESLQIAKKPYRVPGTETVMQSGTKLGDEYYRRSLPLVQTQLAKAGVR